MWSGGDLFIFFCWFIFSLFFFSFLSFSASAKYVHPIQHRSIAPLTTYVCTYFHELKLLLEFADLLLCAPLTHSLTALRYSSDMHSDACKLNASDPIAKTLPLRSPHGGRQTSKVSRPGTVTNCLASGEFFFLSFFSLSNPGFKPASQQSLCIPQIGVS